MHSPTQPPKNPDPLLNTSEAGVYLHTAPRTLTNQRCTGDGPRFLRVKGKVLYRQSALDAYLNECEQRGAA